MGGNSIRIYLLTFQTSYSPTGIYQGTKTSSGLAKTIGNKINNLFRQHSYFSPVRRVGQRESVLIPAIKMEFLGFVVNSLNLTLALPRDKIRKVKKECQGIIDCPQITKRQLAKLLGFLTSTIQAVFPAPLHLQEVKNKVFSLSQGYDSPVQLSPPALEELIWWRNNLEAWNGKSLASGTPDLIIETDASRKGWGAYCMGVSTEGQWAEGESQLHINCLELLAGAFAIKTFAKGKVQMKVCLLMDNMTAAHYINKMGGGGCVQNLPF